MAPHNHVRDQTWWKTPWVKEKESEIFGKIQAMEETILEMDEENLEDSGVDLSTDLWDVISSSNMHADVDEEDVGDDLSFIGHETRHVMTEVLNNILSDLQWIDIESVITVVTMKMEQSVRPTWHLDASDREKMDQFMSAT
ncbi:hypothetical protein R1sor_010528 [Riccia sorocarpa]|uniref:Uncharacterized protein n=1 Tax=Riccia sorocarpa TaxID=122646 RepID=A0ABD3HYA4_9MARC